MGTVSKILPRKQLDRKEEHIHTRSGIMAPRLNNCFSLKTGCYVFAALGFFCGLGGLTAGAEMADTSFIISGLLWTISWANLMAAVKLRLKRSTSSEKTWEESWSWFLPILAWLAIQVLFFIGLFIEGVRRVTRGDNPDAVFVYNATIGLALDAPCWVLVYSFYKEVKKMPHTPPASSDPKPV